MKGYGSTLKEVQQIAWKSINKKTKQCCDERSVSVGEGVFGFWLSAKIFEMQV